MSYADEHAWKQDWPCGDPDKIGAVPFKPHGLDFHGALKAGDVTYLMTDLVGFLLTLEPYGPGCWAWSGRPNRNDHSEPSRHWAAIAIDWRAPDHPNGVRGTWGPHRTAIAARLKDRYEGVIRAGEFFTKTTDGMHFEINDTPAAVKRVANKLRTPVHAHVISNPTPILLGDDMPVIAITESHKHWLTDLLTVKAPISNADEARLLEAGVRKVGVTDAFLAVVPTRGAK